MKRDKYLDLLEKAMMRVTTKYIKVCVATNDGEGDIRRERVYCYELYHQMRCLQNIECLTRYTINGEIDKSGHKIIKDSINPDFVIHINGTMASNHIAIEVKRMWDNGDVKRDLDKLITMMVTYGYQYGVFIMVGETYKKVRDYALRYMNENKDNTNNEFNKEKISSEVPWDRLYIAHQDENGPYEVTMRSFTELLEYTSK